MQRTRLEAFHRSRVVVIVDVVVIVVVVFVEPYSPVTGNRARQLCDSTPRDDVGPMNPVVAYSGPRSCCSRHMRAGEGRAVSGDALTPLSVDTPPDKGVDAPPDKDSRTSPGKDSAGAIRVARLLLALSLDVTATDEEAMRAFSTSSSSFVTLNDFLSYRSSNRNGLPSTRSKWPGASSPPLRCCCRNWAEWPGPLLLLYSGFGGLGRRLELNTRGGWPGASFPPLRRCCLDWAEWPDPLLLLHSSFGGLSRRLDLSRQE